MEHLNCFAVKAMVGAMQDEFKNSILKDCFSNSPDEIAFVFENGGYISINFYNAEIWFSFGKDGVSKSRLFKPQFTDIHGLKINKLIAQNFERSFIMEFEAGFSLAFVCRGRKSNIILFERNEFSDMFRKIHENDRSLKLSDICDRPTELLPLKNIAREEYPFLPEEYFAMSGESHEARINKLNSIAGFGFEPGKRGLTPLYSGNSVLEDISRYTQSCLREIRFNDTRRQLQTGLKKSISDKESFILKNKEALEILEHKRSDEELGNIILSGLHLIPEGVGSVQLPDIYHGNLIDIKLDPELGAVANAERYFKKARGRPYAIRFLKEKITAAELALKTAKEKLAGIEKAESLKALKPFIRHDVSEKTAEELPYRKFSLSGFDILVGKHAESNDKLLNYYSDKDDIWMHAKDVSGSHVILKTSGQKNPPSHILEAAAGLAAYYSKNRNQSLVTVTYTLRKYVRKIKGADKGKVSVSNEKTLLVKPGKSEQ